MTPEDIAKAGTEHAHQTALFLQIKLHLHIWPELEWAFAIPNGGQRNAATAARLKVEGVKSGVSDILLPISRKGYHGFFIEMKKPGEKSKASTNQLLFGAAVTTNGYLFCVCDHWLEAWERITWYMADE